MSYLQTYGGVANGPADTVPARAALIAEGDRANYLCPAALELREPHDILGATAHD